MRKIKTIIQRFEFRKVAAMFLSLVFLLQSCVIYDKKPVIIDEATDAGKVKVVTLDNRESIYHKIYYKEDGFLYGLTVEKFEDTLDIEIPTEQIDIIKAGTDPNISKDLIITNDRRTYRFDTYYSESDTLYGKIKIERPKEVLLMKEDIKGIYLYNKSKSTTRTVFLTLGSVATGLLLYMVLTLATDCWGEDCSGGWFSDGV
jgi:hypothetical protein